jgi:type I restriction enzyme, S subunit
MKRVQLREVADFINGRAFKPEEWETEGLPIIRIQNLTGSTDTINYYSGDVESKYLVRDNDILISWSASLGVYWWKGGDAFLNQHIFKVELKEKLIDKEYFYYAAQNALVEMKSHVHGATMQHITRDPFLAIEIPLPPLTEQKRIASLLARADRLRQLRRTAYDLSASVLQSVFLEMFGRVRINDKKWELARFEDVCETRLGKMLDDKKQTGKHKRPYLRNFNVRWDSLDLSDIAEMDFDEKDRKEFRLQYGDVLICEGGEVGRAAIWRNEMEECYFQKALHRARPNAKMANPEYIVHLLWWMAQSGGLGDFTSQVTIAHLTGEKLKELVIPVPPLSLQEEFAGLVARVESLRGRMGESGRQVQGLFESLLSESFGGG